MKKVQVLLIISMYVLIISCNSNDHEIGNWKVYGGGKENIRYTGLTQIDTNNVTQLTKAWEFHTGDSGQYTQMQFNAIAVDSLVYTISPKLKLIALEASTGKSKWVFDPYAINGNEVIGVGYFAMNVCRGVTYYADKQTKRLFYGAVSNLFCVDALTG